ncbi:penicillin-binding transpeptidase domain-containing protein [Pilimelia columellifera]|uniref:Penicillin-binding transpeptidase domain-containing protein n=1 Tax=Pilimelia columellifera subsp. columellifera TaxID=706583 RepID=A0ABN3NGY7_9ACTN
MRPLPGPTRALGALAVLLTAAGGLAGCSTDSPDPTLAAFLDGWRSGALDKVGFVSPAGEKLAAADVLAQLKQVSGELKDIPPALTRSGRTKANDRAAEYTVDVDWTLPGGARWKYPTTVKLSRKNDAWVVVWEPAVVEPQLTADDALAVERLTAARGPILDATGRPLVAARPVVVVGVQPRLATNVPTLTAAMAAAFKVAGIAVDLADLPARLAAADPDAFVEVVSLREPDYQKIRQRLQPLAGTVFREETRQLAATRTFARALLGTVDPVQRDDMAARPNVYQLGDQVGHGGIQGRYEDRLRGTVGQRVLIASKTPDGATQSREIHRIEAVPGQPVKTTLDVPTQGAAEAALTGQARRAAVVAVRVSDGVVLAAANGPGGGGENLAFTAQVPPGSTFKMVSALGLLDRSAVSLNGPVNCPKTYTVDGRTFSNANKFALGSAPFRVDFAKSCNTAFAALAPKLGPEGLAAAGANLGLGGAWPMGVDTFAGRVSTGGSNAERAAAAFGQGTTVVSPLAMAVATGTVARGGWKPPSVLLDPAPGAAAPPTPTPAGPGASTPADIPASAAPAPAALRATSIGPLHTMMREVVTKGTALALRDLPGGPVHAKTGTAEYDNNPAHTHAWVIGWQGDVAFAVFVENGGASSATAVPITAKFLRALR